MNKENILAFINMRIEGTTEKDIFEMFPGLSNIDFILIMNELVTCGKVEEYKNEKNVKIFKTKHQQNDFEKLVLDLLSDCGDKGVLLRDIKNKTNIPHTYLLKLLKKLEQDCKIKSIKSVNSNKKTYVLYDVEPDKAVTGGIWFTNNDVDLDLVNNLMNVLHVFITKTKEKQIETNNHLILPKIDSLATLASCHAFLIENKVLEVGITMDETKVLLDTLQYDGKIQRFSKNNIDYFYPLQK